MLLFSIGCRRILTNKACVERTLLSVLGFHTCGNDRFGEELKPRLLFDPRKLAMARSPYMKSAFRAAKVRRVTVAQSG